MSKGPQLGVGCASFSNLVGFELPEEVFWRCKQCKLFQPSNLTIVILWFGDFYSYLVWFGFSWLGAGKAVLDLPNFRQDSFRVRWSHFPSSKSLELQNSESTINEHFLSLFFGWRYHICRAVGMAMGCAADRRRSVMREIATKLILSLCEWKRQMERSWILMEENAVFNRVFLLASSWIWSSGLCGILLAFIVLLTIKARTYYVYPLKIVERRYLVHLVYMISTEKLACKHAVRTYCDRSHKEPSGRLPAQSVL